MLSCFNIWGTCPPVSTTVELSAVQFIRLPRKSSCQSGKRSNCTCVGNLRNCINASKCCLETLRHCKAWKNSLISWSSLADSVLPKNVLRIFRMLRLVHFLGSCRTDIFTSMSNGKQKISAQCRQSFHVTSFKAGYSHGDIFRQNSTARRPGSSAWLCF